MPTPPTIDGVYLGVYDNASTFTSATDMTYEQIWDWWDTCAIPNWLLPQLQAIAKRGREPIVCIEPWPISSITSNSSTLLADVATGKYDAQIAAIAADLKSFGKPVIIRWGHEMDVTCRYPWACQPAAQYIAAFKHVVTTFKALCPGQLQFLWTPVANDATCQSYYPGAAYVDLVGISLYEFSTASNAWFGHPMSFADWMNMKYPLLAGFGKPFIIAELGIAKSDNQATWLAAAFAVAPSYPLLKSLVYFNAVESTTWDVNGVNYTLNWEVSPTVFVT